MIRKLFVLDDRFLCIIYLDNLNKIYIKKFKIKNKKSSIHIFQNIFPLKTVQINKKLHYLFRNICKIVKMKCVCDCCEDVCISVEQLDFIFEYVACGIYCVVYTKWNGYVW